MPQQQCEIIREGLSEDPLAFLSKSVIVAADLIDEGRTTTGEAEPKLKQKIAIRNFDALVMKEAQGPCVYSLREANDGYLQAHYLPWNKNTGYYTILDVNSETTLFFTAMLSGCGVGFVEADDHSAVRVSHHNIACFKSDRNFKELAKSLAFTDAKVLPSQYRPGGEGTGFAHVHGVMQGKRWRFYAQFITMKYDVFEIKGVYKLKKKK